MPKTKASLKVPSQKQSANATQEKLLPKFLESGFIKGKLKEKLSLKRSYNAAEVNDRGVRRQLAKKIEPLEKQLKSILEPLETALRDAKSNEYYFESEIKKQKNNVELAKAGKIKTKDPEYFEKKQDQISKMVESLKEDKGKIKKLEKQLKAKKLKDLKKRIKKIEDSYKLKIQSAIKELKRWEKIVEKADNDLDVYLTTFKCLVVENLGYFKPLVEAICSKNRGKENVWVYITLQHKNGKVKWILTYDKMTGKAFESKYIIPEKWLKEPFGADFDYEASITANIHKGGRKGSYHLKKNYDVEVRVSGIHVSRKIWESDSDDYENED